ncbi:MAG: response regulator transcription factor [Lewinellaceae bacterium]|nr:response regulator transcription factor [Lewinellaceae bacterium]
MAPQGKIVDYRLVLQKTPTMPIRVTVVEDNEEIRMLTTSLLNLYADIACVGTFCDAETFLAALPGLDPEVVLMDIGLPGMSGIDCVFKCQDQPAPRPEFIMFTNHMDSKEVFDALAAGANGYVLKGGPPENLAEAIREVTSGGSPMSRQISRMVTRSFHRMEKQHPDLEKLTEQEWAVLQGLDKGLAYKEIAAQRFVSEHTVRTQVRSIYQKLQVHTRTEALNKLHGRE